MVVISNHPKRTKSDYDFSLKNLPLAPHSNPKINRQRINHDDG